MEGAMRKNYVSPDALFAYANRYARRAETAGRGTEYPTFRRAAKRFGVPLDAIEQACEEYDGTGYMRPAVAMGQPGHGYFLLETRGAYLVEAYD